MSNNGKQFATGCMDGFLKLRLYDESSLELVQYLPMQFVPIKSICFSKDDTSIICGCFDGSVQIWDIKTNKCQKLFQAETWGITCISLKNCGRILLCSTVEKRIVVWDIKLNKCVKKFVAHRYGITFIKYSNKSRFFISASNDKKIKLWHSEKYTCIKTLHNYHTLFQQTDICCFTADDSQLAIGQNAQIIIINLKSFTVQQMIKTPHVSDICSVQFAANKKQVITGDIKGNIKIVALYSKENQFQELNYHSHKINGMQLNQDNKKLLSASSDKVLISWFLDKE